MGLPSFSTMVTYKARSIPQIGSHVLKCVSGTTVQLLCSFDTNILLVAYIITGMVTSLMAYSGEYTACCCLAERCTVGQLCCKNAGINA